MVLRTALKAFSLLGPKNLSALSKYTPQLHTSPCKTDDYIRCFFSTLKPRPSSEIKTQTDRNGQFKAKIILTMNFKSPEDCIPFYKLPISTLLHIQRVTLNDVRQGFCENRLYFISSKLKCSPAHLSEKLANRAFVYSLSFDWLESSLNELLDKGVTSERILRDLWVLRYHHQTIRERLQKIRDMGIENVFPWMVRCSPDILNRYISISKETKDILGEAKSTQMYLADRLNTSTEVVEEMCVKIPALKTIRVTKVKKFLDFLIEEGYKVEDIAEKPRILASSQKTVKQRMEQLRKLGINDVNLNVLCRSRKDYKKFYESLQDGLKGYNSNNTYQGLLVHR